MTRVKTTWRFFVAASTLLVLGLAPLPGWSDRHDDDDEEIEFDVAEVFFELNDTDGDLGLHALVDGEPWKKLAIEDTRERNMLNVRVRGRLGRQGLTELFFESAEPNFEDQPPAIFFRRFPAGTYEVEGETLDGKELESETVVTHVLPAPPENVTVNGMPAGPVDEECDEVDLPEVSNDVVIRWDAVTTSHPDLGASDPDIEIIRYQVVAEWEDEDENAFVSSIDIQSDPDVARYQVSFPPEFFIDGAEVKFEVLVREASFNQTAFESCLFEFVED
jgi:hypothetical protein